MNNINFHNNQNTNKYECGCINFNNNINIYISNSIFENNKSKANGGAM